MKGIFHCAASAAIVVLTANACVATPARAAPGAWRFDAARCPDLVEDYRDRRESVRDRRVDRGPLDRLEDRVDRRESRRDERVTVCPASAWVWEGPRRGRRAARPNRAIVYYDAVGRGYFRYGPNRSRVTVVIR
ncbi:MAG: hypothetical protein AAFX08_02665 [Pseudomonadota bacterium]